LRTKRLIGEIKNILRIVVKVIMRVQTKARLETGFGDQIGFIPSFRR
jgi:hypothetical protein